MRSNIDVDTDGISGKINKTMKRPRGNHSADGRWGLQNDTDVDDDDRDGCCAKFHSAQNVQQLPKAILDRTDAQNKSPYFITQTQQLHFKHNYALFDSSNTAEQLGNVPTTISKYGNNP